MYARLTRLKGDPGHMEQATTKSYRDALAQFAATDGSRGAFLLIDRDNAVGIGTTPRDGEDAMTAARERATDCASSRRAASKRGP